MSKYRYYISLYIIIPVIFAGLSILSVIVSFRITEYYMKQEINLTQPIAAWTILIASIAFICGLIVVKLLLRPAQIFIEKTKTKKIIMLAEEIYQPVMWGCPLSPLMWAAVFPSA